MNLNALLGQAREMLCAGAALCLAACAGDAPGTTTTRTLPNGVLLVANDGTGAWTSLTPWRAVEELRIGRADGAGPEVLAGPMALETDASGNLYVLDVIAMEVRAFAPDGRHLRSFGRDGSGPGEFRRPAGMVRGPDGTLWVFDPGNARFTVYDTAGMLRETRPRNLRGSSIPWPGRIDRAARLWDTDAAGAATILVWEEVDGTGAGRASLPEHRREEFSVAAGGVTHQAPVPFTPLLHWALDADGRAWAGVSDRYRLVHFVPGGDTLRVVELTAEPVSVAPAERTTAIEELSWFTQNGGRVDAGRIPAQKPAFTDIRVDDHGFVWVSPSLPAGSSRSAFDVFDPEGVHQGRLTLPIALEPWSPVIIRGDRLYTAVLAPEGHPQVMVFRLEGRPGR